VGRRLPVPGFLTVIAPVQEVGAVNFSTAPSRGHYRPPFANSRRSWLVEEAALSPRGIPAGSRRVSVRRANSSAPRARVSLI